MRIAYLHQLDAVHDDLVDLARLVHRAVDRATTALLEGDLGVAEAVIDGDHAVDRLREEIEEKSVELLSLQNPVAADLRMLVASLQMVGELERMGDLAVHVAKIARMRAPGPTLPTEAVPLFARMAAVCAHMVGRLEGVLRDPIPGAADELETVDDEMDRLRGDTFRILLDEAWRHGVEPAVDVALLGRYYERIADHAVSVARRIVFLATGEQPVRS
ncbi:MAG: phosphate signaling complex protein PhoU [Marmoricola sp.]